VGALSSAGQGWVSASNNAGAAAQRLPRGTPPTIQLNRSITGVQLSTLANELVGVKKVQDFVIAEGVEDKLVADFITLLQVEKIVGNLEIRGSSIVGVVFSKVKQIGRLVARDNGNMLSLTFPKLTRIDQDMLVENNVALQSVHCPLLEAVGGALTLRLLPALSVVGMPRLATLGGNLVVDECSSLRSLCQLGLRAGGMNPSAAVGITRSPKITRGDPEIFRKAKIYAIEECRGVQIEVRSFDDFTNVQRVYNTSLGITVDVGDVTLAWNAMKTVHLGQLLQRVTVIYGDLVITGCNSLEALTTATTGLSYLTKVGGKFTVAGNEALKSIALPVLAVVESDFAMSNNNRLESIDLNRLREVRSRLSVENEKQLGSNPDVPGLKLDKLERVGGMSLKGLPRLPAVLLPQLATSTTQTGVSFTDLMAATHVTMDSLVTTTGGLRLTQLPKVATVSCNDLTSTGGDLAFSDLGAAQLLHFPNLTTVAGTLKIANCGALAKLCGMSKVSESTKIQVTNSPALATGPVALLAKAGVTAALCITTTTTTTTSTVTRTTTTTNTTTPLLQDTFTPVVNTTTSTTTTTMFANCDSCCPAAAQSFTAVEFSFGMMGALILGSLFGVGTTICCLYASDRRERETNRVLSTQRLEPLDGPKTTYNKLGPSTAGHPGPSGSALPNIDSTRMILANDADGDDLGDIMY